MKLCIVRSEGAHLPNVHPLLPLPPSVTTSAHCPQGHILHKGETPLVLSVLCPEKREGCPSAFPRSLHWAREGKRGMPLSHAIPSSRNTFPSFWLAPKAYKPQNPAEKALLPLHHNCEGKNAVSVMTRTTGHIDTQTVLLRSSFINWGENAEHIC